MLQHMTEAQVNTNITQNNETFSKIGVINCTELVCETQTATIENKDTITEQYTTTPENDYNTFSNTSEATTVISDTVTKEPINNKTVKEKNKVFKYLFKKNDVQNEISKLKGHPKNSLSRKKRSAEFTTETKFSAAVKSAPLIVDYKTAHDREHIEPLTTTLSPFGPNAAKVIQESALADFNIETLHDNQNDRKAPQISVTNEPEKQYARKIEDKDNNGSSESTGNNNNDQSNESGQSKENYASNENSQSSESVEKENYEKRKDYTIKPNNRAYSEYTQDSSEDSREVSREVKTTELPKIQDVDLDVFSYERIQVNDKGEIEPTKELSESHEKDITEHLTITSTSNPATHSAEINEQKANYNTEPVQIDDDKIKPVIEKTDESSESSEESGDLKLYNTGKPQTEKNDFPPSFIDLPPNNYNPAVQEKEKKVNVKDEFERIPLNYNHDKNNATQDEKNDKGIISKKDNKPTKFEQPEDFTEPPSSDDATEFVLPEQPVVYDDKLNFKFSDVTIKLPEIKLPEDILAYNYYDEPPKQRQNKKQQKQRKFFYYDHDDDSEENPKNSQYNDEPDYHDNKYYSNNHDKDNYRRHPEKEDKEEESEEDEDLYEKFVRERFGKRGTFQKRSEELRALPQDIALKDTIKKVLKKAHETSKEAEKSGDPNAGYMWTLEYQQPL